MSHAPHMDVHCPGSPLPRVYVSRAVGATGVGAVHAAHPWWILQGPTGIRLCSRLDSRQCCVHQPWHHHQPACPTNHRCALGCRCRWACGVTWHLRGDVRGAGVAAAGVECAGPRPRPAETGPASRERRVRAARPGRPVVPVNTAQYARVVCARRAQRAHAQSHQGGEQHLVALTASARLLSPTGLSPQISNYTRDTALTRVVYTPATLAATGATGVSFFSPSLFK